MANLNDVEAKIQKIREQTQSIAQQVPGAVSVAQAKPAANNVEAIPVSSLQSPQSLIKLPQQKPDTTNYAGIINDGATLSKVYGAQDQQEGEMTASGLFDRYLGAMAANAPKDMSGDYEELNAGLEEKQNAVIASKKNLEMLNAQLQGITDTATAQNLAMEKQAATGGMNSPLFLSRQQAENSRQAAIASLPLQAKILAAQAQYTADNDTLLAAQNKVDKLFDIKSRYEERQQEYNQKLITSVFDYASDEQKAQLEAKAAGDKQAYEERQSKLKTAQEYAKMAIQNGQGEVAGLLMELDASDPEFQSKLARYTSQIQDDSAALDRQYKQAQIAKIYGDMAGTPEQQEKATEKERMENETVQALQATKTTIDNLLSDATVNKVVNKGVWTKAFPLAWERMGNDEKNYIATVEQLISKGTLDALIAAKARGATFGALSDKETAMLRSAASKIGTWAMTDKNDKVLGYAIDKSSFEKELKTLKTLADKAIAAITGEEVDEGGDAIPFKSSSGKTYNLPY